MKGRPRLRDDLSELRGYHSPQVEVTVRLNTNESPYPPPEAFVEAFRAAVAAVPSNRYPDRGAGELRAALGRFLDQPAERIFCANGSNEVLQTILLAYGGPGRRAAVFEPSYVLHAHIANITGTGLVTGERGPDFALDAAGAASFVAGEAPDVVFLTTPNNPTGTVAPRATVEALAEAAPGLLVVDEAYADFAPWSALELVGDDTALVVVRTYSKVWSMAAFRLGFCVAPPGLVADLEKVVLPYHLSAPTQVAGTIALDFVPEMRARVEAIVVERERLVSALGALDGVEVFPSGANFVLFRVAARGSGGVPQDAGRNVWQGLLDKDVLVRDFSRWPRLEGCLRVTVGRPEENDAFLTALKEVLAG
ncbi:MAG: histidinol-phosphate transaminase [Actinomycetota bacterium]|nr:histidinol-phosphate transaminase [Actinomycetota bacterium]